MHKLVRDPVAPACLARYRYGRDQWSMRSPTAEERAQIWEKLDAMQGHRCAYCESELTGQKRKIEHFRQRDTNRYPQGTFEWTNLFGACTHTGHCDSSKDKHGPYDHHLLLKPDDEDPEQFLIFNPYGEVYPRRSLPEARFRRAQATIDILNLNEKSLVARRRAAVLRYEAQAKELSSIALEANDVEVLEMVEQEIKAELEKLALYPYVTALRHLFTRS